jgi:hypothetical protein
MFWFFKLDLRTCVFSGGLTIVLDAVLLLLIRFTSVGFRIDGPDLTLDARYGVIFGALGLMSFSAEWWIVYLGVKSRVAMLSNEDTSE